MNKIKFQYKKSSLIEESIIDSLLEKLNPEIKKIKSQFNQGYASEYAFTYIPFDESNIETIQKVILEKQKLQPVSLVVIGIGGSNLGTYAVHEAINGKLYNQNNSTYPDSNRRIKAYFADTVDSDYINSIAQLIEQELIQNKNVIINIVSKSGTTLETIAIFEYFLSILKKYKPQSFNEYVVITTDLDSPLYNYGKNIKSTILIIPKNVGGRYSVFSSVGLFPLAMLGVNIKELIKGACNCNLNDAAISAAILYQHYKSGINIHDTFLFSVNLEQLGKWYRQLMAESLGKNNIGMTPTVSIGTTDLHSLLQLNLGGPRDKFTTFVTIDNKTNIKVPILHEFGNMFAEIEGLEFSKLMHSIIKGNEIAYKKNNRPFCTIELEDKSEYNLGQFMQFKMYEIVYLAYLFNVNPFDQPNVEAYKIETKHILNKYKL